MSKLLEFDKLNNIRDLGGMRSSDGRCIKSGKLVRCGHLVDLTKEDKEKLEKLADVIVDFRTDRERSERANDQIPQISYIHIPIVDSLTAGISREEAADRSVVEKFLLEPDAAKQYMCDMYRSLASASALSQYKEYIRILLKDHDGAVIWHCTAGKDRAGIASAIVEKLLDITEEDIINDYLSTNTYLERDIKYLTGYIKKQAKTDSLLADEALRYLFTAQREYIDAFYSEIIAEYGDFDTFARSGLGLTGEDIDTLRDKYLE